MQTLMKRGDALELESVLDHVSHLVPDQHEEMEAFNRFKYAVGKNYRKVAAVNEETNAKLRGILHADDPDFPRYRAALKSLAEKYADRNDDGKVIYLDPDETQVQIQNESMPLYEAEKLELAEQFAPFLERQKQREAEADAYLAGMCTVDLHLVAFRALPRSLGGVWMNAIAPMIHGIPAELC